MSGNRISESTQEAVPIAQEALTADSYNVHIPAVVDVKALRRRLGLSQASFSARFGLSLRTRRNWEQDKRIPDPAAGPT